MNRGQRIELLKSSAAGLARRSWAEIDLILRQFGQPTTDLWNGDDEYAYALEMLSSIDDALLLELNEYLGGPPTDVEHHSAVGPWDEGYLRLFMSHVSSERTFVAEVKRSLADYGIDAFVAHDDIEPSEEWAQTIELALGTCDGLAAFLHDGFNTSSWCDQEVGYCLRTRVKIVPLMFGAILPYGFMGRYQGARCADLGAEAVARRIFDVLLNDDVTGPRLQDGIIASLAASTSFQQANSRSDQLTHISEWTSERVRRLGQALDNHEVAGAFRAAPRVRGILSREGGLTVAPSDEVPF